MGRWAGVSPCPARIPGCSQCPEDKCKEGEVATCDGGRELTCASSSKAPWTFRGCYNDDHNRAFDGGYIRVGRGSNTVTDCATHCSGYAFMAIQHGDACFCGNTYESGPAYAKTTDSDCFSSDNPQCQVTNGCGAANKNSVYALQAPVLVRNESAPTVSTVVTFNRSGATVNTSTAGSPNTSIATMPTTVASASSTIPTNTIPMNTTIPAVPATLGS